MEMTFGTIIREARKKRGWTLNQFLKKLDNKISKGYMSRIENWDEPPTPELMLKMCVILDLPEDELFESARQVRLKIYEGALTRRYQKALGLWRMKKSYLEHIELEKQTKIE